MTNNYQKYENVIKSYTFKYWIGLFIAFGSLIFSCYFVATSNLIKVSLSLFVTIPSVIYTTYILVSLSEYSVRNKSIKKRHNELLNRYDNDYKEFINQ